MMVGLLGWGALEGGGGVAGILRALVCLAFLLRLSLQVLLLLPLHLVLAFEHDANAAVLVRVQVYRFQKAANQKCKAALQQATMQQPSAVPVAV